jgi:TPR repeat protein
MKTRKMKTPKKMKRKTRTREGIGAFKPLTALLFSLVLLTGMVHADPAPPPDAAALSYEKGIALQSGKGGPADPAAARREFEKAAGEGHALAAVQLGILHASGSGGPRDDVRALSYFSQAAGKGQREALYNKGLFLLQGRGAARDPATALGSLAAAAAAGSLPAHIKLADLFYFGGDGVPKDHAKARPHVEAAANAGDPWACNIFATMAELGQTMKVDRNTARHWFKVAAEKGNVKAQGNLGRILRDGQPTDQEKIEAYKWLKVASLQSNSMATYQLDLHRRTLTAAQIEEGERQAARFIYLARRRGAESDPASSPAK